MKKFIAKFFVIFLAIISQQILSGCNPKFKCSLKEIISENGGYELLEIPRDFDGTGTIVRYQEGKEIPIASSDYCFPKRDVQRTRGSAKLPYCNKNEKFDLDIGFQYLEPIGIKAILETHNVTNIKIKFEDVTIEKLPYIKIEEYIKKRWKDPTYSSCINHIDKNDVVMVEMLKGKPTYEFIKKDGLKLGLTSSVLNKLGISGRLGTEYRVEGEYGLKCSAPIYFGYKAVRLVSDISSEELKVKGITPGSKETFRQKVIIKVEELTLNEIVELKAKSR